MPPENNLTIRCRPMKAFYLSKPGDAGFNKIPVSMSRYHPGKLMTVCQHIRSWSYYAHGTQKDIEELR